VTDPNTLVRETLDRVIKDRRVYLDSDRGIIKLHLLREISDKSHEISECLNLIRSALQGIEMNTRPKP